MVPRDHCGRWDSGAISVHSTPWALAGEHRSEARASTLTLTSCPQVTRLCDLSVEGDSVTSVGWSERVSEEGERCVTPKGGRVEPT